MSAIERGLYVTVGAADLAAEKVRDLPAVKFVVERTSKLRDTSLIDQAREIEPKVRKQASELQKRGEKVVKQLRTEAKERREKIREFPAEARKQIQELPDNARKQVETIRTDARKQVTEIRGRIEKVFGRDNGKAPARKSNVSKAAAAAKSSTEAS